MADRVTESVIQEDLTAVTSCYSPDAVLIAPEGTFKGREQIAEFFAAWFDPFSDLAVEATTKAEWDNTTLDEWTLRCTHTGQLAMPTGESVPATGTRITVRGADVCTVEGGLVTEHRMYYDQVEVLGQLGLLPE
ncbi:MAG: ester cyclase [Acidimicrobiales bacterium]